MDETGTILSMAPKHTWVIDEFLNQPWFNLISSPEFRVYDESFQLQVLQTDILFNTSTIFEWSCTGDRNNSIRS
jgi:hypothetical protein